MQFTVAILAGGRSSRMGTDKAFVPLLGRPLIEHVIERTATLGQAATMIVTNTPAPYLEFGLPLVADVIPGAGSLGGIYSALVYSDTPQTLIVGCDMPLIDADLLRTLLALAREPAGPYDAVVPRYEGTPQGLHALYAASCRAAMQQHLLEQRYQIKTFFNAIHTRYVDEREYAHIDRDGRSFRNVNTPQDLTETEQLLLSG